MRPLILMPTINSRTSNAYATYSCCLYTEMPAPPTGRALLLGGGAAMGLGVQGGYRAMCGRSVVLAVKRKEKKTDNPSVRARQAPTRGLSDKAATLSRTIRELSDNPLGQRSNTPCF